MTLIKEPRERNKKLAKKLEKYGYKVITKPLKKIWANNRKRDFFYKCNFDVEITLDVSCNIDKIDHIIIGSGDSDFVAIRKFVIKHNKAFMTLCFEKLVAWEVRKGYHIFFEDIQKFVEKKDKKSPPFLAGDLTINKVSIFIGFIKGQFRLV